jgi:hypothetical protein
MSNRQNEPIRLEDAIRLLAGGIPDQEIASTKFVGHQTMTYGSTLTDKDTITRGDIIARLGQDNKISLETRITFCTMIREDNVLIQRDEGLNAGDVTKALASHLDGITEWHDQHNVKQTSISGGQLGIESFGTDQLNKNIVETLETRVKANTIHPNPAALETPNQPAWLTNEPPPSTPNI